MFDFKPDPLKDQFFLMDGEIIKKIVSFADLKRSDIVLEVGAGTGNLTRELAKKAGKVIAFEIDERLKPYLSKLPKNVDIRYENAWNYIQLHGKWKKKKEYNKVVSNLPYSFVEQFLHNLTFLEYDKVILLVPAKIVNKINTNEIFSSFFKAKVLMEIPKEKFDPIPRTNSLLIDLVKLPDPLETKNIGKFLRQYMYQHEDQLVKNSLKEGIIKYKKLVNSKDITKNDARKIVDDKNLPKNELEDTPSRTIYDLVEEKFDTI